jgi:maltodextrin utilization protein YvdJ
VLDVALHFGAQVEFEDECIIRVSSHVADQFAQQLVEACLVNGFLHAQ